jgi:hypothetical protein
MPESQKAIIKFLSKNFPGLQFITVVRMSLVSPPPPPQMAGQYPETAEILPFYLTSLSSLVSICRATKILFILSSSTPLHVQKASRGIMYAIRKKPLNKSTQCMLLIYK